MDGKEQEEHWATVTRRRIPRSPSSYPPRQPAPPAAGTSRNRSSTQGTKGKHHTSLRAQSQSGTPRTPASGSSPAETRIIGQTSEGLLPPGHRGPQGGPTLWGGEISDGAPCGRRSWSPPDPILDRNREDDSIRTSSPCLPPVDRVGSGDGHDHSHLGSHDRGASRDWEGFRRHAVREPAMENLSSNPPYSGPADQSSPPVHNYGPTYMKERSVEEQQDLLKRLLSTSPPSSHRRPCDATTMLDSLYLQILETCLVNQRDRGDPDVFGDCLSVLHTFLCTTERTSASVAVSMLQEGSEKSEINNGTAEGVLLRLHAVLYVQDGLVMSYHKSFSDFLFDQHRSKEFYCDKEQVHHRLASGCFGIMARQLQFNIANIATSYQMDNNNPALPTCIDANISTPLRYACRNWSAHLILTPFEALDSYVGLMHEFLQLRILFWMESMNLLGQRGWCQRMLRDAQQWFLKSKGPTELVGKLADAVAFAAYHSASKAALSTPHLYLSSLATFSRHSAIVQDWRKQFRSIPAFISAHGVYGEALVACIPVRSEVTALAISPDGVHIAVGSDDGLVRVLDLSTGEEVRVLKGNNSKVKVLKGHTSKVNAVAYSPGGSHVVSGSGNKSIQVWDVATGEEVRVLDGHTDWVRAVGYSPDGSHVVSGSDDKSIRVWDVATGEEVRVLEGHTGYVCTVAYSPDGSHVISGSSDWSIRVWDVATGEEVRVLKGHTNWVRAVAYSPDGSHVVSSADDKSIRVWDVATGEEVRVLKGHTNWVRAVAYSPDGSHVVSSADDKSIRVWDVATGEEVTVLKGHTSWVNAVAYLPDGSHVVSGARDNSIRVWDVATREEVRVLEGHTSDICAVAYLPDGIHVVSGSKDNSTWVWDVATGEQVRVLKGHTKSVCALAYSPDGSHVISGSGDWSIRVWDVATGEEVVKPATTTLKNNR